MTIYTAKYPQNEGSAIAAFTALDMIRHPILITHEEDDSLLFINDEARSFLGVSGVPFKSAHEALSHGQFASFEYVEQQLRTDGRSEGIHVVIEDESLVCYRLDVNPMPSGHRVISLSPIQIERDHQQLKLLLRVAECGQSRVPVEEVCRQIIDATFEYLRVDIAVIALLDRDLLKPIAWRGLMIDPEFGATGVVTQEVEHALATNEPVATGGVEWGEGLGDGLTGTHFVVPLVVGEHAVGTLHLGALSSVRLFKFSDTDGLTSDPASALDDMDRTFLSTLAEYVATAIDNAECYQRFESSRLQLAAVVNAIQEGVMVFDSDGTILVANPESRRISEIDWTNLNARRPYRVCASDGRPLPRPEWPFFKAAADRTNISEEHLIFDFGDRVKHVVVDVVTVDPSTLVGTVRDITEQHENAQRYEDFLSAIGHELRSPLTPLLGMLQIIHSRAEGGEAVDLELVRRSEKQVKRLSRLIDAVLDVTRIETGRIALNRERVSITRLVENMREDWKLQYAHHPIEIVAESGSIIANVDPGRIEQVLSNLVDNAVKHSPKGETIEIRIESNPLRISVVDTGSGMDAETMAHAFERFFQGGPINSKGIGLGLYISREIIERHGGTISVESVVGNGTSVTISIPD